MGYPNHEIYFHIEAPGEREQAYHPWLKERI